MQTQKKMNHNNENNKNNNDNNNIRKHNHKNKNKNNDNIKNNVSNKENDIKQIRMGTGLAGCISKQFVSVSLTMFVLCKFSHVCAL